MRLVIREYLTTLKEDQELDALLGDLLFAMNILPIVKPQKGRQHGVDLLAYGTGPEDKVDKTYLCVVKQGDLSRSNWHTSKNDVRTSLTEIFDVYIPTMLSEKYLKSPKKIIVVCNGVLQQTVQINWMNYRKQHEKKGKIEIDFWGVDELTLKIEKYLFNEQIFPANVQKLLRKTLAFMDLNDYDLSSFYQLVESVLSQPFKHSNKNIDAIKKIRLLNLCVHIVYKSANEIENLKPGFYAANHTLLNTWGWIRENDLLTEHEVITAYLKLYFTKKEIDSAYYLKVYKYCGIQDGLSRYGAGFTSEIEYPLITLEQIGILSIIGLTRMWEAHLFSGDDEQLQYSLEQFAYAEHMAQGIAQLITFNSSSHYFKFDEHCIELNLALLLFYHTDLHETAVRWLFDIINHLFQIYTLKGFFPLFVTSYDELIESTIIKERIEIKSSFLLTILAEWAIVFKQPVLYELVREFIKQNCPEVDLQLWYPDEETEISAYKGQDAHRTGSVQTSIKIPENLLEYEMQIAEELKLFNKEKDFATIKNSFYIIDLIASQHFRTYVYPYYWRSLLETRFCFG